MSRPALAIINLANLRHNYRLLKRHAGRADIMAVVKANAYGHGMSIVAPALQAEGCRSFGVTDAVEGASLRRMLPESDITLLSGIFDGEDAALAREWRLTPAITEMHQLERLTAAGFPGSVWIKVDTGMNRMGAARPEILFEACAAAGIAIKGLMSHLACADTPDHPLNRQQAQTFSRLHRRLCPGLAGSLLNSAGMFAMPDMAGEVVRPGIALYGSDPFPGNPLGLKPVMQLRGEIIQVRDVPAGANISYGASYVTEKPMRVAIVSLGYADGLPRGLSNRGSGFANSHRLPIIGRVCMDYTLLDVTDADVGLGEGIEFWGGTLLANEIAEMLGTISYTLFTGVGQRVPRLASG